MDGGLNTFQNVPQSSITDLVADQTTQNNRLTTNEGNISSLTTDLSNHEASTAEHGVGIVAGVNEAQTLTNKVMSGSNNTFSNIPMGSLQRFILALQGDDQNKQIPPSTERYATTFNTEVNIGGFGDASNSAERIIPITGLYYISFRGEFRRTNTSQGAEVRIRVRVGGTPNEATDGDPRLESGADFGSSGVTDHKITLHCEGIRPLNQGDRIKFTIHNLTTGGNITVEGRDEVSRVTMFYLGPAS